MLNGILVLDKPAGWTSFDALAKLRGILKEKRIGHAGTLDPMATGVLVVFIGKATRACEFASGFDKEYIARFITGIETDTQDTTGSVTARSDKVPSYEEVESVLKAFTGDILQTPPMYSAIKKDGQRLYKLARRGLEVKREPRPVTIKKLELLGFHPEKSEYEIRVVCSKGTYVRTLCHDIGASLKCYASMSSLRRIKSGFFSIETAHTLDEAALYAAQGNAAELLLPVESLFSDYPAISPDDAFIRALKNGATLPPLPETYPAGLCRVYDREGNFIMLAKLNKSDDGLNFNRIKSFY